MAKKEAIDERAKELFAAEFLAMRESGYDWSDLCGATKNKWRRRAEKDFRKRKVATSDARRVQQADKPESL